MSRKKSHTQRKAEFLKAAEAFGDAVGRSMPADSLASITEDWGRRIGTQRTAEAEQANQPAQRGERDDHQRVAEVQAISDQANLSTDDAMLRVRDEGWKEVKVVAMSEVQVRPAEARQSEQPKGRGRKSQAVKALIARWCT
jgi:hypothetical protein